MSGFLLLCLVCLVALPVVGAWYTGVELIAPLLWRARLIGQAYRAPRLLPPPGGPSGLSPEQRPEIRALIADATATRTGPFTRDFSSTLQGLPIYVRTQARVVDDHGATVGIPYTLGEQAETRSVVVTWVVADLRGRVSDKLTFHVEVGDEERGFGDEGLVAALLDGKARRQLGRGDRLTLADAFLVLESPFLLADRVPAPVVEGLARIAARLAHACDPPESAPDVAALLRANLERDELDRVRAKAADLLIARYPAEADRAAALALCDTSAEVRFAAARHLGFEGFWVLERVAFDRTQVGSAADGLRQRALRFMVREFSTESMLPLLERAIRGGPDALRQIAIRQVGELRHAPAVAWLAALPRSNEVETVAAGCEALAQIGDAAAEALLIELLARPEPVVVRAAVEAIAQVGTVASVPALTRVVERCSEREIRLSAATAIQLVQARGAPEALGALSLLEPGERAGQLALLSENEPRKRRPEPDGRDPLADGCEGAAAGPRR